MQSQVLLKDSLIKELVRVKNDTSKCNILYELINEIEDNNEWSKYNEELKKICELKLKRISKKDPYYLFYYKYLASSYNNEGYLYMERSENDSALRYFNKAKQIYLETNSLERMIPTMENMSKIYLKQGNIKRALESASFCLKYAEISQKKSMISKQLGNIAVIYHTQGDLAKAIEYNERCVKIEESTNNFKGLANIYNNIGAIYYYLNNYQKALKYHLKSLAMQEKLGDKGGISTSLNNIGVIYGKNFDTLCVNANKEECKLESLKKAIDYFQRSLTIRLELDDKQGMVMAYANIGRIYTQLKKFKLAEEYLKKATYYSLEIKYPQSLKSASKANYDLYKAIGNYKSALENYELYIQMRDSINNESTRKASVRSQLKHEYEKQAAADSVAHAKESEIKNAELAKQSAEIKAKKNQQYALFGGLFLVMIFAGFMYNRFKVTQKQKGIIEEQKNVVEEQKKLVEEKQKEILDSIHYAKRIQMAQVPSEKRVSSILRKLRG